MARPTDAEVGSFGLALYAQLEPMQYGEAGADYALLKFCGAIGQMLQDIDEVAHDDQVPWSSLLDIDRIPHAAIPWLAQFVGVTINPDFTVVQQKQQIRSHEGWGRGTPAALRNSVRWLLGGSQTVEIVERSTDAYTLQVYTYASETHPDETYQDYYNSYLTYQLFYQQWDTYLQAWLAIQTNLIEYLLNVNKPAGLVLTYSVLPGSPGTLNSYATVFIKYPAYEDLWIADETYRDVYVEV